MDGDTGNLFHAYTDNYKCANAKEHLIGNKFKEQEEKRNNNFSYDEKEDKNISYADIIYLSPKFQVRSNEKLPQKKDRVQKKHIRKGSVDFKSFKDKISAYSVISKCKIKQKISTLNHRSGLNIQELHSDYSCNKSNNEVKVLYERETTQRERKNHVHLKDSGTRAAKKSQSSDLFGFQRCIQRKRNVHYNLNVIYKFLRKDGKLKDHNVLRCKHYSFENINQNKCKKISSVVKIENNVPTHYNLVDFTQCSSVSNIYLLKPKDVKKEEPKKKNNKCGSVVKVNKRRRVLTKSDSHDSTNTQTSTIKRKEKKVSTCTCPTSKLFSWRTTAVNICQPSRWLCRHLTETSGQETNVSNKNKENNNVYSNPLDFFKATLKYFLCAITFIVWLPCILVIGLLWLISYPLRPQDSKYIENIRTKNKRNNTKLSKILCKCKRNKQKSKKNKRKRSGKTSSSDKPKEKSSKLYCKNENGMVKENTKKSLKKIKKSCEKNKKTLRKSNTGFKLSDRSTKITAFPSKVSKQSMDKKKQKNVTFKQPIEKTCEKTLYKKTQKNQCMCSAPIRSQNLEDDKYKSLQIKELKNKEKKLRSYKIDPNECQQIMLKKPRTAKSKRRQIKMCIPKTLSKLFQIAFRHTCSTTNEIANFHKVPKVKNCYNTDIVPECADLMKSQNFDSGKKKKSRRKKCKSYCCKKGCSGSILHKSFNRNELASKSSTIDRDNPKKNAKVATKKSTSVVKFFPAPTRQIQQPAPVIKYFPPPNQQSNCYSPPANEHPKKESVDENTKSIHQAPAEMKNHAQMKDKKVTKKGSKVKGTTVVKFFPPPTSAKDQCEVDNTEGSLQKSSSKTKSLASPRLPAHTTSTNTDPVKPTSARKFFSVPRKKSQTVSSNTSIPKSSSDNNYLKSYRRNTSSKGSATNARTPTSVIKFLPAPCPQKCSASSNTSAQKTTGTFLNTPKTTTVVKFFPPPQQRQINTAINTAEPKSSPLKSFLSGLRCSSRTRSIGSGARLEKRTSVFKYLPPPRQETRTLAVNAVKTPSVLSNVSTQSYPKDKVPGDKFQRKSTFNQKIPKTSQNYQNTSRTNMDPNKASKKTVYPPPSSPLSKKRSRGVTTKRPSQVVKFFPKQHYNTRSFAVSARPSDKSNEKIRTANKPIGTPKGNVSVIKFYPHPHIVTQTIGTNTFLRTLDKKCDASKLTNIIKFYPSPKKATMNRGTVPPKFKDQNLENLRKLQRAIKSKGSKDTFDDNDAQPNFIRGLRKIKDRQTIRKLGQRPQASRASKQASDVKSIAGGKIKQKSRLVQSPCQPDCKGVQANRKNYFNTKSYYVQRSSNRFRTERKAGTERSAGSERKAVTGRKAGAERNALQKSRRESTDQRVSFATKYSKLIPNKAKPDESEKRPRGKIKRMFDKIFKDEEIDCTELMMKSSERPCRWIYENWPSAYPAFMVLYKIYNNMIHIFFFFFAACIWCPLFCWCFIFYFFVVKKLFC